MPVSEFSRPATRLFNLRCAATYDHATSGDLFRETHQLSALYEKPQNGVCSEYPAQHAH